ncbi:MAG TPA: hypothetical protein VIT42_06905 [Microlunatus sp.]
MDLSLYVESVRAGVADAASLADDHTRHVADRLGNAIGAATRLALINALSDAADTISADLAPGSVELRMSGSDPEFVVSAPSRGTEPTLLLPPPDEEAAETDPDEEPVARISLRLPSSVKAKVDRMADREQISTNAWLLRAVMDALGERRTRPEGWPAPPGAPVPPGPPVFGLHGPFGPHGVFGANGPFGPDGLFRSHPRHEPPEHRHPRGNVQGWVQ